MVDILLFGAFAATLFGIARYHKLALRIAASGLITVLVVRLAMTDFSLVEHLHEEWRDLLNLAGLLLGFSVLANHFERSRLPERLTRVLPGGVAGAFLLLVIVALLSMVLDNIAAALIGGSAAITLFRRKVHIGYLAAIVAASNAGGAGSVVGDTTTTMIWLSGVAPQHVLHATIGAVVAIAFFGTFASRQQNALQPLVAEGYGTDGVDYAQVGIVGLILVAAVATNVLFELPAAGVWGAILLGSTVRKPEWSVLPQAAVGTAFLLCLVMSASMMPVDQLPQPSEWTALGLGGVSSVFDNIPLTKLAIEQGNYDWGFLAYCVGYGGSMMWFGSSAGVALSGLFPEARSVKHWLLGGWHVAVGYLLGFFAMLLLLGWHPEHAAKAPHTVDGQAIYQHEPGSPLK
ncbi:MAG: citrate transporter [Planctomycetes bacterium]|nr:citrate transporter [Planctomycetota bacterium]